MGPVTSLHWAELVVAVLSILGVGYAAFRVTLSSISDGYIDQYLLEPKRKAKNAHEQVDDVDAKVENLSEDVAAVKEQQELQTDALIALGETLNNGADFDTESFKQRADCERADRFKKHSDD